MTEIKNKEAFEFGGMINSFKMKKQTVITKRKNLMKNYDKKIFRFMKISGSEIKVPGSKIDYYGEDLIKSVSGVGEFAKVIRTEG